MGVSLTKSRAIAERAANLMSSITKLIGESFKLHAQALGGYENSMMPHDGDAEQNRDMTPNGGVNSMEMQTAY